MKSQASLLPLERQQKILEILREEFTARSSALSEIFGVSEVTIRRDFDVLEDEGLVERIHGGAIFRQERVSGKFHCGNSIKENLQEKKQIAKRTAAMIESQDVVYLGEGTTAAFVVRYIEPGLACTIFTNNFGVTAEIGRTNAEIIFLGGAYNPETNALTGPLTMEMIR